MLIYLLGYMGCGKSTLGRKLSKALDLQYIDLDLLIEEKENCSISNIFTFMGEEYFRKCELAILEEVSLKENSLLQNKYGNHQEVGKIYLSKTANKGTLSKANKFQKTSALNCKNRQGKSFSFY